MVELEEQATSEPNRHIIERPRLTRLLDETTARVIMLVAPAGYGKTTLARQWLAGRKHVWYPARPSSADMAALGTGVADAAKGKVPNLGSRFGAWLHTRRGAQDAARVADLLAEDLSDWPIDLWFAIDDYQSLTPDAEHVIDRIRAIDNLRLIVTSRRRPLWCTSRDLLYGAVFELDETALRMSDEEARAVLRSTDRDAEQLIALAAGWPAIIGLASFAERSLLSDRGDLPPGLHDFIAEELFASLATSSRDKLAQLSLLPSITRGGARNLLGSDGNAVVLDGARVGFLTDERSGSFAMHPLLRAFLRRKMLEMPEHELHGTVAPVVRLLIAEQRWDEALEVARQFDMPAMLDELLEASLYELLEKGRIETVATLVEVGRVRGASEALIDLADAELAFREGFHERSRRLAEQAGAALAGRSRLASKALSLAGNSAYFTEATTRADANFRWARKLAASREDERRALWGLFLSALEQEDDSAATLLTEFEGMSGSSPDELARIQNGRLHFGTRLGTLSYGLSGAEAVAGIVNEAKDPVVRASFWHTYAAACRAAANYSEALGASDNALREISAFDLDFGKPHVYLTRAGALMGTAAYEEALALLEEVARAATRNGDMYLQMNERTNRCKLYLLVGEVGDALRVTEVASDGGSRGQLAEFLASRAVALATNGSRQDALELLEKAESMSRENEATALCTCVRALFGVDKQDALVELMPRLRATVGKGVLDPFVFAFRLDRRLPREVARIFGTHSALQGVLSLVDASSQSSPGDRGVVPKALEDVGLTPRELEVLASLAEGKTNKEIAALLFLSESTVKVHVRHVLRKTGARTRTEAAIYALRMRRREVPEEPSAPTEDLGPEP